jgi:hypothetical protein
LALFIALLTAPLPALAEVGVRVGGGPDLIYNPGVGYYFLYEGIHGITDFAPAEAHVMVSYWLAGSILSLDVELAEQFYLNHSPTLPLRSGTVVRPGVRVSPFRIPLYARVAIPINIETPEPYDSGRSTFDLRFGVGCSLPVTVFRIYFETDADFSLAGGGNRPPSSFETWHVWLSTGVDLRF